MSTLKDLCNVCESNRKIKEAGREAYLPWVEEWLVVHFDPDDDYNELAPAYEESRQKMLAQPRKPKDWRDEELRTLVWEELCSDTGCMCVSICESCGGHGGWAGRVPWEDRGCSQCAETGYVGDPEDIIKREIKLLESMAAKKIEAAIVVAKVA